METTSSTGMSRTTGYGQEAPALERKVEALIQRMRSHPTIFGVFAEQRPVIVSFVEVVPRPASVPAGAPAVVPADDVIKDGWTLDDLQAFAQSMKGGDCSEMLDI